MSSLTIVCIVEHVYGGTGLSTSDHAQLTPVDKQAQGVLRFSLRQRRDVAAQAFGGGGGDERKGHLLLFRRKTRDGTAAALSGAVGRRRGGGGEDALSGVPPAGVPFRARGLRRGAAYLAGSVEDPGGR